MSTFDEMVSTSSATISFAPSSSQSVATIFSAIKLPNLDTYGVLENPVRDRRGMQRRLVQSLFPGDYKVSETMPYPFSAVKLAHSAVSTSHFTSIDYQLVMSRVEHLFEDDEDAPSQYAHDMVKKLLREAAEELGTNFPLGSASIGPSDSVRVVWSYGGRELRLVCGGSRSNKSYLYFETGEKHNVSYDLNGMVLARHLQWVVGEF